MDGVFNGLDKGLLRMPWGFHLDKGHRRSVSSDKGHAQRTSQKGHLLCKGRNCWSSPMCRGYAIYASPNDSLFGSHYNHVSVAT